MGTDNKCKTPSLQKYIKNTAGIFWYDSSLFLNRLNLQDSIDKTFLFARPCN